MNTQSSISLLALHPDLEEGGFGSVYLIKHKDGNYFALKEVNLLELEEKGHLAAIKEALLMKKSRHKNIIGFKDIHDLNGKLGIIMEFAESKYRLQAF